MDVRISKICDDWITKGCHVHVGSVELVVRPDHRGGIMVKKWFASTLDDDADIAIRIVNEWLELRENRQRLHRDVGRARRYVQGELGRLSERAQGRALEFTFLLVALKKRGVV